jgi:hypothetical protein
MLMSLAKEKSKKGFDIAIKKFEEPVTLLCLYKSVPENLEDRFSEYHDLIIKRSARLLN